MQYWAILAMMMSFVGFSKWLLFAVRCAVILAVSSSQAQSNPKWLNRPFVKALAEGDAIPGRSGARFASFARFTLRDGAIHIVAGANTNTHGLFRWQNGALTKLILAGNPAPGGGAFRTVYFTTDLAGGALNFVADVTTDQTSVAQGLFEWRDGAIKTIFDTRQPLGGRTFLHFTSPQRASSEVVFASQYLEGGQTNTGIFRYDGVTLRTVVVTGTDLPGSLGPFAGLPGPYNPSGLDNQGLLLFDFGAHQLAFDGQSVVFAARDSSDLFFHTGVYLAATGGALIKLVDANDWYPNDYPPNQFTYGEQSAVFHTVDIQDGIPAFLSGVPVADLLYSSLSIGRSNLIYQSTGGFCQTSQGNAFNIYDGLDGKDVSHVGYVDGDGDDAAIRVQFGDGTWGLYAAIGPIDGRPQFEPIRFANGKVVFGFYTNPGFQYRLEYKKALSDPEWQIRSQFTAAYAGVYYETLTLNVADRSSRFFRLSRVP